ncbi:hypothetical protein DUI87_27321 [Hirundo rustica rustica]|uniref:Uncharacterized protein n=1 Tax=Hirundo rustica rustica TaxID=333673 RepID=A0A3M0J5P5_HIRRU|nr:hypothetical protein DUI87_27321 [Hirundo rustica rustica]
MMEPLGEEEERVLKEFEFDSGKLVGELGQDFEGLGALLAAPKETPVNQERGTGDSCCRPPSPDAVPLPDELEEGLEDGPVPPPAEPLAEPTIGLKELTEQIQVVMQRLDERAHAAAELLSTATVTGQDEPTSFSSQLTPMQRLLEQTAESSSQATPLPAPPVTRWSRIIGDAILEGQWKPAGHMACPVACPVVFRDGNPVCEQHEWKILQWAKKYCKRARLEI